MPPGHIGAGPASAGEPLACAANVENSWVRCAFPQEGQFSSAASLERRSSFSNLVPQSSHLYS